MISEACSTRVGLLDADEQLIGQMPIAETADTGSLTLTAVDTPAEIAVETGEMASYTLSLSTVGESATGEITTETQDQGEPELALSVEAPNEIPPIGVSKWGTRSRTSATRWRPRWRWNW
jgi:hypothetical protein